MFRSSLRILCLACVSIASSIIYKERETPTPYLLSTKLATGKRNTRAIAPASLAIPLATLGSDKPILF
jgi:hypothetical protein